jgi:branched-chain amino acid transport system ATP-binding protein
LASEPSRARQASGSETLPHIAAVGLSAGYGDEPVVRGVDLAIRKGEVLLVLGHNGAGKTTLMRALFGLLRPTQGKVNYLGADITGHTPAQNVRNGIAFVPQGHGIFPTLSVRTNLELGAFAADKRLTGERLATAYELFPILKERADQIGGTLSGGQQQMLAIGMALMHAPQVLLLDEPSIGLAPNLVDRVMHSVQTINRRFGTTIAMVEQSVKYALPIADRVAVLKTGRKIYDGDPAPLHDRVELMRLY